MDRNAVLTGAAVGAIVLLGLYFLTQSEEQQSPDATGKKTAAGAPDASDRKIVDEAEEYARKFPGGPLHVYFGSQTGTAEGFAKLLVKEGISHGFDAKRVDLEDFSAEQLIACTLAVFVLATYGEGEPTDNAQSFYKWMKQEEVEVEKRDTADGAEGGPLSHTSYTVFGLGNRQYEQFNKMGRLTDELLARLGATRVCAYGEGDDDGTLEDDFQQWRDNILWPALVEQFHCGNNDDACNEVKEQKVELQFTVKELGPQTTDMKTIERIDPRKKLVNSSTKHFFTSPQARVVVNRELRTHPTDTDTGSEEVVVGSTRHIEIDLKGTGVTYETADNLAIIPENPPETVRSLAAALDYDLDMIFSVELIDKGTDSDVRHSFPSPCSVREALSVYFDLQGQVRQSLLRDLLPYVTDPNQKEWLRGVVAKDNRSAFKSTIVDEYRSLADLLCKELNSCKIPLQDFMHIVPFMQPRYYTISSSSSCFPDTVHITVSVTRTETKSGGSFKGLCSNYLQGLTAGASSCRVFVRASTFRLPKHLSTPIIMIGPGTGIAPMRALLQERRYRAEQQQQQKKNKKNKKKDTASAASPSSSTDLLGAGKNTLYFGCKYSNVDYIYRDELEEFATKNVLTDLHLAFSRDQPEKVYVQMLLKRPENSVSFIADIEAGAYIFVCGATAMGNDVHEAIVAIVAETKNMTHSAAADYVKSLQDKGRYVQELWSE